jgi:hypothetical protein
MKKELTKSLLIGAAAILGVNVLTGCASMNHDSAQAGNGALSSVAFTTVTSPKDLAKWTGDRFLWPSLRSIDTYTFQVRDTGGNPGDELTVSTSPVVSTTAQDAVGGAPDLYQSGSGGYKIIEYRPGFNSR